MITRKDLAQALFSKSATAVTMQLDSDEPEGKPWRFKCEGGQATLSCPTGTSAQRKLYEIFAYTATQGIVVDVEDPIPVNEMFRLLDIPIILGDHTDEFVQIHNAFGTKLLDRGLSGTYFILFDWLLGPQDHEELYRIQEIKI